MDNSNTYLIGFPQTHTPLQALSSVNRCIKIVLQMVNWFLAGKDIGQPRRRFLWDDVSQFTSENLQMLKCRREIASIFVCFILIFTSIKAKPSFFSWEVSVIVSAVFTGLTTWIMWEQTLELSVCLRIWRSVSKNNPHRAPEMLHYLYEVQPLREM